MAKFNLVHNPGDEMSDCEYILEIFRDTDGAFVGSMYIKDMAQAELVQARINGTKLPGQGGGRFGVLIRGFQIMAKGFKKSQEVAQKIDKAYNFDAALGTGKGLRIGMPQPSAQPRAAAQASGTFDTNMVSPRAQSAGAPAARESVFGVTPRFAIDNGFSPRFKFDSGVKMVGAAGGRGGAAGKKTADSNASQ